ncbi:hypothetical protein GJAV_G00182220 [Gymnothorax javanicus]|nr:hypothetical protein GJAV_G00182220 [Gymnothorax javanicus]
MAASVSKGSEGIYAGLVSPEQDVYRTLDHTSPNSPRSQHQEMAVSTVSKDSEGIYTGLVSPDRDVYSTLDQTSPSRDQHQEGSVGSSHPYRLAAVCLGLLCALLLTATLVLCVLYTSLSQNYSLLERDQEELRASNSTMIQERDQLQRDYTILKKERNQQETNYTRLKTERDQLQRDNIFKQAVLKKFPLIYQYCPISSQKRECKPCPQGWQLFHSKCYFFSTESKSWAESRIDCIKRGADLVIIESKEEQDFISTNSKYYDHWIGLSDTVTEGTWLWVDGSPLQGGFWVRGEPNDQFHYRGTDCVVTAQREKAWIDTHCKRFSRFICETDTLHS